jgi:hypothetical protein
MTDADHAHPGRPRSPRAAALAGIIFSLLMGAFYVLIRVSIPADPNAEATWLDENAGTVTLALSLVPFAGIAFLWFIGVIRDRIGRSEDQFFSSVFFGSGLLFLAMVFASAAIGSGLLIAYEAQPSEIFDSGLYTFGREMTYRVSNTYALRMAAVFMLSLGTIWFRTRTMPRWLAFLTYTAALALMFTLSYSLWVSLVFPVWVLIVSIYILVLNYRGDDTLATIAAARAPT